MKLKVFALTLVILIAMALPGTASAAGDQPYTLAAPTNLTAELKYDFEGVPYFELKLNTPQSVVAVNNNILDDGYPGVISDEISIQFDYKYGDYDWNEGDSLYWDTSAYLTDFLSTGSYDYYPWGEEGPSGEFNIEAEVYQFRAYFFAAWGYEGDWIDKTVKSGYSNTVTIGNPSYYSGASGWAEAELDKALEYGFITERIRDNMSAGITREEFAEVAVKMYEKYMGKTASYTDMSAFTDTRNQEIFKAYELKIVNGMGNSQFGPNLLITRAQMAAMLYRLVEAIEPYTDFSAAGAPQFADEKDIPGWALENVRFMSKMGFINGVSGNRFAPADTSTREQAVAVAVRVYEYYEGITG